MECEPLDRTGECFMKLFNILKNIISELSKRSDYIIDSGTNYIKWSGGRFECWNQESATIASGSQYVDKTINFPDSFVGTYHLTYGSATNTAYHQNVAVPSTYSKSASSAVVRVWRDVAASAGSASTYFVWRAIGYWKSVGGVTRNILPAFSERRCWA